MIRHGEREAGAGGCPSGRRCVHPSEIYGQKYLDRRKNVGYSPPGVDCESPMHMSMSADKML